MTEVTHSYTQSNELIQSCYKMTLNEKRLLILGVSQLNPKDSYLDLDRSNPIEIKVTAEEWIKVYKDDSRNAYRDMRQAAKKIFKRSIVLHPRVGVEEEFQWFNYAKYDDNKDEVTLQARRDYAALQRIALHAVQQETASGDALTRRTLGLLGWGGSAGSATSRWVCDGRSVAHREITLATRL